MTVAQMIKEKISMGKICRICDRKFFLFQTYSEYAGDLEKIDS